MFTIRLLEELALNAMPTLESLHYDGWELRFANGYPRRAHSIQLLYPSLLPLDEKIDFCQAWYTAHGTGSAARTVFKFTLAAPSGLEAALKARGYDEEAPTSVQTLDLTHADPLPADDRAAEVVIEPRLSEAWAADYAHLNEENPTRAATTRQLLERVTIESAFVRLRVGGETVALGRGALEQGWIGFYEIVTDPRFRQQGWGLRLMQTILRWGMERGARNAYLQVMTSNPPALRLYGKLGFREQYRYWYLQTPG